MTRSVATLGMGLVLSGCAMGSAEKNLALQQMWGDYTSAGDGDFGGPPPPPSGENTLVSAGAPLPRSNESASAWVQTGRSLRLAHAEVSRAVQTSFIPALDVVQGRLEEQTTDISENSENAHDVQREWQRNPDSLALLELAERLSMPGAALENPCVDTQPETACSTFAMTPFFEALDRAAAGTGSARVTVFGNSLHASDRIVNIVRDRLQARFGNAGQGYLLPDRLADNGSRRRTGHRARGFVPYNVVWGAKTKYPVGAAGSLHVGRNRAKTSFKLQGETVLRVYGLAHPHAGQVRISTEGSTESFAMSAPKQEGRFVEFAIPANSTELILEATGAQTPVYGASFEGAGPGVILDTLAIIGADSTRYLRSDPDLFRAHLESLRPDLVAVMLGGNEVKRLAHGSAKPEIVKQDLTALIARVRNARPDASCLLVGPLENVFGSQPTRQKRAIRVGAQWTGRPETLWVNDMMRSVASEHGCAYFDLYAAMGTAGALQRLHAAKMLHEDMIHPKGKGLDVIGELIVDAILNAYLASPVASQSRDPIARTAFR